MKEILIEKGVKEEGKLIYADKYLIKQSWLATLFGAVDRVEFRNVRMNMEYYNKIKPNIQKMINQ